jgi:hypothetical protein
MPLSLDTFAKWIEPDRDGDQVDRIDATAYSAVGSPVMDADGLAFDAVTDHLDSGTGAGNGVDTTALDGLTMIYMARHDIGATSQYLVYMGYGSGVTDNYLYLVPTPTGGRPGATVFDTPSGFQSVNVDALDLRLPTSTPTNDPAIYAQVVRIAASEIDIALTTQGSADPAADLAATRDTTLGGTNLLGWACTRLMLNSRRGSNTGLEGSFKRLAFAKKWMTDPEIVELVQAASFAAYFGSGLVSRRGTRPFATGRRRSMLVR